MASKPLAPETCEIPKSQRFVNGPELGKIFTEGVLREKGRKNEKVEEGVDRFVYTQREVADLLGLHFTSVRRIMNQRSKNAKKIDLTLKRGFHSVP